MDGRGLIGNANRIDHSTVLIDDVEHRVMCAAHTRVFGEVAAASQLRHNGRDSDRSVGFQGCRIGDCVAVRAGSLTGESQT